MKFLGSNEEFVFQTLVLQLSAHELVVFEQLSSYLLDNLSEKELLDVQNISEDDDCTGYEVMEHHRNEFRFIMYHFKIQSELTSEEINAWEYTNSFDEYYEV